MIDAEGNFDAEFNPTQMLGEGYEDYKGLDDVKSLPQLVKFAADNHRSFRKKQENVIQKPADDADDTIKGDYAKALRAELGIQDAAENYTFAELGGGEEYREGSKEYWGDIFKKLNISQEQATGLTNALHEMQRENIKKDGEALNVADEKKLTEEITALDEIFPGDKKPVALRNVLALIDKYGTEALKGAVKEGKLFDNHDLKAWAPLVDLNSLPFLANIGAAMANATMPTGEATKHGAIAGPQVAAYAAANNQTVEEIQKIIANYPSSWQSMLKEPA